MIITSDNKEGARNGLLHLTFLDHLCITDCGWSREEIKEIHKGAVHKL